MKYNEFLNRKKHSNNEYGFEPNYSPDFLFDFQKYTLEYMLKKGRCAVFLDTGLGKTIIELVAAQNIVKKYNKNVLIITPLAVAFQFIKEAEKFGINDIEYSKDGKFKSKIVVCNYERLEHFKPEDFIAVMLDESSILKNFDGAYKTHITAFMRKINYRSLFTATPSPNDFIELGTSSEALGFLGYTDMLTKFFTNNENAISPMNIGTKWILKGHAQDKFFEWVSGWSISMRKPSDLGFADDKYILPELLINHYMVRNQEPINANGHYLIFNRDAKRLTDIKNENRSTITERCEKAVELANNYDTSVYWCNLNSESQLLHELDKNSVELIGTMSIDKKEEILLAFSDGHIKKLITKPKMSAFGLNWQHCNHTVYFPTYSYEQYYQSIRRFWRFGQQRAVNVDLVYSDGELRVLQGLLAKAEKANELFTKLNNSLHKDFKVTKKEFTKQIELPKFMVA